MIYECNLSHEPDCRTCLLPGRGMDSKGLRTFHDFLNISFWNNTMNLILTQPLLKNIFTLCLCDLMID